MGSRSSKPIDPVLGVQTTQPSAKQPRHMKQHKTKSLCASPKIGYAKCLAYEATNDDGTPLAATPAVSGGYGPVEFHTAYNLPCTPGGSVATSCSTPGTFGPQTIAIVDAGNLTTGGATVESSLQTYDQHYNIPACTAANGCLNIVNQSGATSPLPTSQGWDDEIALDVETAHTICQTCKILLVEANTNNDNDLSAAEVTAASFNPTSISNSYGGSDFSVDDASYIHPGIAVVVSTGDSGSQSNGQGWPADIPQVVAASGTSLNINLDNTWSSETLWAYSGGNGTGGGCATNYSAPSWQTSLTEWSTNGCGSKRAFGDVSADANPNTGAAISIGTSWFLYGGTSLSAPLIASMFALTGGTPSGSTSSSIPYSSFTAANFHDITSGNSCTFGGQQHCTTAVGFDTPSGLGAPNGLGGFSPPPTQPTGLTATDVDQSHTHLSWTASTGNQAISTYRIYRGGVQIATSNTTSYNDSGLSANTSYTYHVTAQDALGNLSPASTDSTVGTFLEADINQDGHINLLDFSLLASKYGQSGAGLGRSDINNDGTVNLLDFSLLASTYGSE